ncbi:hypothetical protein J3F81_005395, partial [Coemansia sp. RSA 371]
RCIYCGGCSMVASCCRLSRQDFSVTLRISKNWLKKKRKRRFAVQTARASRQTPSQYSRLRKSRCLRCWTKRTV